MASICSSISTHLQNAYQTFKPVSLKEWAAVGLVGAMAIASGQAALVATGAYSVYKLTGRTEKAPAANPNEVHEQIYTAPRSPGFDYTPYQAKIAQLRIDPSVIGIALAKNIHGGLSPIYIKVQRPNNYTCNFIAYDLATGTSLGFATTKPFLGSNNYLNDLWICGRPENYLGYGSDPSEVSKVMVDQVQNDSKTLKNVGVILLKAANQYFQPECQCRMIFDSVRNTQPYYYRQGYRISDPRKQGVLNAKFAQIARSGRIAREDMGLHTMHLHDTARSMLARDIAENPIGFPAAR